MRKVARLLPIVIMVMLVTALSVSPVLADPGNGKGQGQGNGGGKGNGNGGNDSQGTATLSANPNPAAPNSEVRVSGCGFDSSTPAEVHIEHNGTIDAFGVSVWGDGCISFPYTTSESGRYSLRGFQPAKKRTLNLVAEGSLEVQ